MKTFINILNNVLAAAVGSVLVACSPVEVISTNQHADVDYAAYKTFNFLDVSFKNDSLASPERPEIQLLKQAIAREMGALGYRQDPDPDLWINIGIMVEQKVQTRETDIREAPLYIGQRRYSWKSEEVVLDRYEQGTVAVDIIDANRFERIWEGVATGTLSDNLQKMENRIDEAMERLFDRYPLQAH